VPQQQLLVPVAATTTTTTTTTSLKFEDAFEETLDEAAAQERYVELPEHDCKYCSIYSPFSVYSCQESDHHA
jgi:hypothetical protein